jgi:hypothetical protein
LSYASSRLFHRPRQLHQIIFTLPPPSPVPPPILIAAAFISDIDAVTAYIFAGQRSHALDYSFSVSFDTSAGHSSVIFTTRRRELPPRRHSCRQIAATPRRLPLMSLLMPTLHVSIRQPTFSFIFADAQTCAAVTD